MASNDETKDGRISLLPSEQTLLKFGVPPISTLTWFHAPVDIGKLRERAAFVILKNSWLAGWFKKDGNGLWGLEYSNIPDLNAAKTLLEEKGLFHEMEMKPGEMKIDPIIHSRTEQDLIILEAYPDLLLKTNEQFGSPPRLFKISMLPSADGKFVGLAFSLSHGIGDGHTFYKLYESLLTDNDMSSPLQVERRMGTVAEQAKVLGKDDMGVMARPDFIFSIIFSRVCDSLLGRLWPSQFSKVSKTYVLDQDKLSKLKKQTKLPFVSTNDIVSSWFFSKAGFGAMLMNLRGRLSGHTDDLAGNYGALVYYRSSDAATPDLIRQSLKECKRVVTPEQRVTGFAMLCKWKTHFFTNWASLYPKSVDKLGVYKTHSHGPVGKVRSVLPSAFAVGVMYQSSPTQLSINISASPNAHKTMDASIIAIDDVLINNK